MLLDYSLTSVPPALEFCLPSYCVFCSDWLSGLPMTGEIFESIKYHFPSHCSIQRVTVNEYNRTIEHYLVNHMF